MNKVILMGRLTRDPEVRYTSGENSLAIARYTLAVDRKIRKDGDATADLEYDLTRLQIIKRARSGKAKQVEDDLYPASGKGQI